MDDLFDEDDEFMRSFMQKRMEELMDKNVSTVSAYGKIIDIHNDGQFLDAVGKQVNFTTASQVCSHLLVRTKFSGSFISLSRP